MQSSTVTLKSANKLIEIQKEKCEQKQVAFYTVTKGHIHYLD